MRILDRDSRKTCFVDFNKMFCYRMGMEVKRDVIAIVSMGLVLVVVVLLVFFLGSFVEEGTELCNVSSDCEGLGHKNCSGSWACEGGYCRWECESGAECKEPNDCEGKPHIMCTGRWKCLDGECSWECEVEETEEHEGTLFIEHKKTIEGELLGGSYAKSFTYGEDKYEYDEGSRTLTIYRDRDLVGVSAVYAYSETILGDAGEGSKEELSMIYSVPSDAGADTISRIWDNGRIAISYGQQAVTLSPGEEWENVVVSEDSGNYGTGIIKLTITDKIKNHGFVNIEKETE
jgi:hypothetical protein